MRIDESSVAIHGAQPIRVTISRKPGIESAFHHGVAQAGDVRLNRLRIEAREKRIACPVDFLKTNTRFVKKSGQAALPRAIHGIDHKQATGGTDSIQVNHTFKPREVRTDQVRLLNARGLAPDGAIVLLARFVEMSLYAMDDGRSR